MAMTEIILNTNDPYFQISQTMNGVDYSFQFRYNGRINRWIMSLFDSERNPVVEGLSVLCGKQMFYSYLARYPNVPRDLLVFHNTVNKNEPPEFADLGFTVKMVMVNGD